MKKKYLLHILVCLLITKSAFAQYTTLLNFDGANNGKNPFGSLFSDGTFLYGMTVIGGSNDKGTIFKILPDGSGYTKLLDFAGAANGSYPSSSLISDNIFLYGTTQIGGVYNKGTIFKIKPDGSNYIKLMDLDEATTGSKPIGSLFFDGTFLYGMTNTGGTNNLGTIFKIMPDGSGYSKLLDFTGSTNGSNPYGALISDGTFLYGMTATGGTNNLGIIFKIKNDGSSFTKLMDFDGALNGSNPLGSLLSFGNYLFGVTEKGGTDNLGTIFKIMTDGSGYEKLIDYTDATIGSNPSGSLISDGSFLYGMTWQGGINNFGTIFKIMQDGTGYIKLLDFLDPINGSYPGESLISLPPFLYGMTTTGGTNDFGVVFKINMTTGIDEINVNSEFTIYPNPTTDIINISSSLNKLQFISLSNTMGELVLSEEFKFNSETQMTIDLSEQKPGIYFLKVGDFTKKIIRL
jgi:uncharacterized repeat protein (TIGR03803 family)